MNKSLWFILSLLVIICTLGSHAQKEVWQTISIDEMFVLADQNSKSLRPLVTGIHEANEAVKVARSGRLPEIEISLSFSYLGDAYLFDRNFSNGMNVSMPHFGNNVFVEISQVIYAGGAISNGISIAKLQKENAELSLERNRNSIRFLLIGYYLELFKQQNMLQVYEKNIEQTHQVLKDMQVKSSEGVVLQNDITRYELLLSNLELTRLQMQNTLSILNINLITILGLPQNTRIVPDTTILSGILPVDDNEYWLNTASENSPVLKQLNLFIEIAKYNDKIIKSGRLPKVVFFARNYLDGPITMEVPPINKNINYAYAGINLSYSFSSLYKTKQAVNQSKYAIQQSKEQYDDAKEQTELILKADYIKYLESYEQLKTQQKSVELANQNYAVIRNRYKNDMALITDMLDASNAQLNAELQLANARINIIFNYYKLKQASGNL